MTYNRKGYFILVLIIMGLLFGTRLLRLGGTGAKAALFSLLSMLPGVILAITVHEFGHALASDRLGDPTPRRQGRLSLNPLRHIDPFGFLALVLFHFGWGKPVETDERYYRKRRQGQIIVSLAGVLMNLITAVILLVLPVRLLYAKAGGVMYGAFGIAYTICADAAYINIVLMIFNLIPLPPLDGFQLVTALFELRSRPWYFKFCQLGPFLLILFIAFGVVDRVLEPCVTALYMFLTKILVFGGTGIPM